MKTNEIKKADWQAYFDKITHLMHDRSVNIEVTGFDRGDQLVAQDMPLKGIHYDPSNQTLQISSLETCHVINSPDGVFASIESGCIDSLEIVDGEKRRQIIQFLHPLALRIF